MGVKQSFTLDQITKHISHRRTASLLLLHGLLALSHEAHPFPVPAPLNRLPGKDLVVLFRLLGSTDGSGRSTPLLSIESQESVVASGIQGVSSTFVNTIYSVIHTTNPKTHRGELLL